MLQLKEYQQEALDALAEYLQTARLCGPAEAFARITRKHPSDNRRQEYHTRWQLEDAPYVCLRLPTGGGKTLLAAHSVGIAARAYLDRDLPFAVWLVPTNTIRRQTVEALKNHAHPCRQALEEYFGEIAVFDVEDVNMIRPVDAFEKCCIVVATMQTLRVADANKIKRKIYGANENFEPHFRLLANSLETLDRENGKVVPSFMNMAHQLRPLVIIDEAHKMISGLSGEVMQRLNPSCVIEFTATPVESNVLYRVFPSRLKQEEMVKLPFNLEEHALWQNAVKSAMLKRDALAKDAAKDADYIRPLVLFQAEKAGCECTVDILKNFLLNEGALPQEIAVATGEQRELDKIDVFDRTCPVKYVITIEALKEGWDCSFAYVFCSAANIRSSIDVEQLLGRVMRMPYAKARSQESLNMAYAFVVAPTFGEAAADINACMLNMGFDAEEAEDNIRQLKLCGDEDIWGDRLAIGKEEEKDKEPELRLEVEKAPDLTSLDKEEKKGIRIDSKDGKTVVTVKGMLTRDAEEKIVAVTKKDKKEEAAIKARQHRRKVREAMPPTPAEKGVVFAVPMLQLELDGYYELAEPDLLLPETWSPLAMLASGVPVFGKDEFSFDAATRSFQFFLEGERMRYRPLDGPIQGFLLNLPEKNYTEFPLIRWLASFCRQSDVSHEDMLEFCNRSVHSLLDAGHPLTSLEQGRKVLARLILEKIRDSRTKAKKSAFQNELLRGVMPAKVDFEPGFTFPKKNYAEGVSRYSGAYQFKKHYVDIPRDLEAKGEEFRCAQALDMDPRVETWLRNVDRQPESFFLPTSSDKFYPDFVARLQDGRVLVMEYKGKHLLETPDTLEKRNIGEFWANKSQGKGCFALVCESVDRHNFAAQMRKVCS